jgi:hypothetical protein
MAHSRLFFESSYAAYRGITELFDFIDPVRAALWNLRSRINERVAQRPSATEEELHAELIAPAGVRYRNIKRWAAGSQRSSEDQLVRFTLIALCAIYESWTFATVKLITGTEALHKGLQSPTRLDRGVGPALGTLLADGGSAVLRKCFSGSLEQHRKFSGSRLEPLLIFYRYCKECRNMITHEGALADAKTVTAHAELAALRAADLGMKRLPPVAPPSLGQRVELSLEGSIALSDVILRLIVTLDAKLALCSGAEDYLVKRWLEVHGAGKVYHGFRETRDRRLAADFAKLEMPPADHWQLLGQLLKSKGAIDWRP